MIACRDVTRLRGAYVALELDRNLEVEVRRHLEACPSCSAALAAEEPAAALALRLPELGEVEDPAFVGEVLAGIHQRRVESGLVHRRRRVLAAAAGLVIAVVAGWVWLQSGGAPQAPAVAARTRPAPASVEPAFVEVEGEGVRLYQIDSAPQGNVRIAFIVDPQLEL